MAWVIGFIVAVVLVVAVVRAGAKPKKGTKRRQAPPETSQHTSGHGFTVSVSTDTAKAPATRPKHRSRKGFDIRWFGKDAELKVGGFVLKSPCVYASSGDVNGYLWATDPSEVLIQAPVRRARTEVGDMGYWPWYSRMDPEHRFEYLSWLASGRATLPVREGHLFLYYYGIERRLLLDEADRAWGLQEVVRLRKLDELRIGTREGRSFRTYSTGLLWFEIARTPSLFDEKAFGQVMRLTERWTPELMTAPLAWLSSKERPLPAAMARQIAATDPTAQRSVVTKRVPQKFNELFETRYRETYGGDGMTLRVSKRPTWHTYRPASGGLEEMRVQVPNPMGIKSQFKKLPDIWNSCIADLRKLSRVSASLDGDEMTVDAWEAMPDELRADVDHPLTTPVAEILSRHAAIDDGDRDETERRTASMVPAGSFAELVGIERRPKLTATQSRKVATTLENTGYGLVPDARLTPIRYGWDDLVAVVPGLDDDDVDSARYNAAACVLRLGLMIALADGEADEVELRMLTDHIDSVFDLSPEEHQRIAALRDLLLTTGSDIRPIARKIQEMLPAGARQKVGRLLVVIAAATNGIDRSERAALRKAFRALDLAPELLEETIAEVSPEADEAEVSVKAPGLSDRDGETLPAQKTTPAFRLNHAAISTIMAETREVSVLLAEAMGAADAESADDASVPITADDAAAVASSERATATVAGPGGRYEPLFVALIDRDRWARDDADAVARSHGLMLDAGVETINDWAFDTLGAPLIEDEGDELVVDRSLLEGE
ncbi:MAG: hypothetical protein CMD39_08295 [Gammaproteobacteria bacterium]|nr:hypothetical protein [Gammaproteobacteria bacterium]